MGGLCFILSIISVSAIFIYGSDLGSAETKRCLLALAAAVFCGLLGLADDYGKITSKSNAGISGKLRLVCEFLIGLALGSALYFMQLTPELILSCNPANGAVPLSIKMNSGITLAYDFLLLPFLIAASSNALNLHDGMDGLCGGSSAIFFLTLAAILGFCLLPGLCWLAACASGALLGFLLYNKYKARVFMGDTGSLFIGALMAGIAAVSGLLLWFIPLTIIYILETMSVIIQVVYFKLTKPYQPDKAMSAFSLALYKLRHRLPGEGKRLFRMAPIHHHFEALALDAGGKEWQVVICFWLAQALVSACIFMLIRLF